MLRRDFFKRLLAGLGALAAPAANPVAADAVARVQACADLPGCATPDDMLRTARQIARFVLSLDTPHRLAAVKQLVAENPAMHALVRAEIRDMQMAAWRRREETDGAA